MMEERMALEHQAQAQEAGGLVEVAKGREIAEAQSAMVVAKRFPRDVIRVQERIKNACQREGLAKVAIYQYARGGTDISGPSIRLLEAIAQQWGNLQYGIRELEQGANDSLIEAFCWDLESNVRECKLFRVPHARFTKQGGKQRLVDPRDIYEAVANQGARRLRSCMQGVIPGDIVAEAQEECIKTLKLKVDISPERISNLIEMFGVLGVDKAAIEARIQRHIGAITPGQMVSLGSIYNSIKDGMAEARDFFPIAEKPSAVDRLKEKLTQAGARPAADPARPPVPARPVPEEGGFYSPHVNQIPPITPPPPLEPEQESTEFQSIMNEEFDTPPPPERDPYDKVRDALSREERGIFDIYTEKVLTANRLDLARLRKQLEKQTTMTAFMNQYDAYFHKHSASLRPEHSTPEEVPAPAFDSAAELALFRDKKATGFTSYLKDNRHRLDTLPPEIMKVIRAKCRTIFREDLETVLQGLFPGPQQTQPSAITRAAKDPATTMVACPDAGGDLMTLDYCNSTGEYDNFGCKYREGCSVHNDKP